jgi:hypothetical protein
MPRYFLGFGLSPYGQHNRRRQDQFEGVMEEFRR